MLLIKLGVTKNTVVRKPKKEIAQSNMQLEKELHDSEDLFANRPNLNVLIESLRPLVAKETIKLIDQAEIANLNQKIESIQIKLEVSKTEYQNKSQF